jgi:hypothetical protein
MQSDHEERDEDDELEWDNDDEPWNPTHSSYRSSSVQQSPFPAQVPSTVLDLPNAPIELQFSGPIPGISFVQFDILLSTARLQEDALALNASHPLIGKLMASETLTQLLADRLNLDN